MVNHSTHAVILIIDDNPTNIEILYGTLRESGYEILIEMDGKSALAQARNTLPDLILLDIMMPDLDGYEVCRQLKADPKTKDIPIIFVTALDEILDKVRAFSIGGVDYITKPFEALEVLARVERLLQLRKLQIQLQAQNAQLQFLLSVTQSINEASDTNSVLETALARVCQTVGWELGEAWIPNPDLKVLECGSYWYTSDENLLKFRQLSQHLTFAPDVGLPGRIWSTKQTQWIEDLSQESENSFLRCQAAATAGLKAALGVPVLADKEVLAILVFFQKSPLTDTRRSLELVNAVATQMGTMIQRKKAEAALRQANQELTRLALLDGLTQVANRRRFDEYLLAEWQRLQPEQRSLSLILCDVDCFKRFNDCYGHQRGDECLQQVAQAISRAISRPVDLVARYGGEEFAVILPDVDGDIATLTAETIRREVQQLKIPHAQSDISQFVTLSLGISGTVPTKDSSPESLIAAADAALYEAKEQGRDRIVTHSGSLTAKHP